MLWSKTLLGLVVSAGVACAQDPSGLPRLKTNTACTGGNGEGDHAHPIKPGETRVMGEVQGPGIIKQFIT
jgi:hypothetical protein